MIRTLVILATVLCLALVAVLALFAVSWWRDKPAEVVLVAGEPSETVHIGEPVVCTVAVRLPWHRRPIREPEIAAGEGRQVVRSGPMRWRGSGLRGWRWQSTVVLQATAFALQERATATLFFTANRRGEAQPMVVELPFPEVAPRVLGEDEKLAVAAAIAAAESDAAPPAWRWLALAMVLLAALAVLLAIVRGKGMAGGAPPVKPPWETAQLALQRLEDRLPLAPAIFYQELTDIVRDYLESRFAIPANELTTPEFMALIKGGDGLEPRHQRMLGEFLNAADKVKFAQAEATVEHMSLALASAGQFVLDTRDDAGAHPLAAAENENEEAGA